MAEEGRLTHVDPKGWAVARSLVTAAECGILAGAFEPSSPRLLSDGRAPFVDRIERAARVVSSSIDRVRTAVFHVRGSSDWHTDVSNSYIYPSYASVWIPVAEPVRLSVVGCDTPADPHLHDELAVALELAPGDAWIARNDVVHRVDGGGLLIEFRAICSTATVTRQQLMDMGALKFDRMARMRIVFARRFATFQVAQRDALSLDEYDAIYDELEAREKELCKQLGATRLSNSRFEDLVYDLTVDYARRQERA